VHQGPDDGGSKYFWNTGKLLPHYTALQPIRQPFLGTVLLVWVWGRNQKATNQYIHSHSVHPKKIWYVHCDGKKPIKQCSIFHWYDGTHLQFHTATDMNNVLTEVKCLRKRRNHQAVCISAVLFNYYDVLHLPFISCFVDYYKMLQCKAQCLTKMQNNSTCSSVSPELLNKWVSG
jgi:hypothetical protein